ncbi:hypothetical protein [Spirochaeta isovalerica]|uniref:Uncharacterized protein n=1 Tax=Spirochaeta isovalerica TaxID=150 RepID=A0A841R621_9SPIO|nr:hypothetical protein [Spirochaeta isovalerica]MBB6478500.1 hypothetical protein [Spirochaeta isovalerica]
MINPLFEEQIKAGFINFLMFRLHLAGLAVITFLVFLFYPSQPVSYFLARSVKPEMFNIALYTILTFISYLTIKSAVSNIQNTKIISMDDWFLYTGITAGTFLAGRLSYGLFYSLFLNLLFMPILMVAGSVSAISPANLGAIILFMIMVTIDLYLLGLFFFVIFKKQHWILTLIIWFSAVVIVFLSPNFFPDSHLMLLFIKLQDSRDLIRTLSGPVYLWIGVTFFLTGAICLIVNLYSRSIHDKQR